MLRQKGFNNNFTTFGIRRKNGIHCTTGSLGHGLPISTGMAFARKRAKKWKNICDDKDGECQRVLLRVTLMHLNIN